MENVSSTQLSVLVIGASLKPDRASNTLLNMLDAEKFNVSAVGSKAGLVNEHEISTDRPELETVHTVSLYLRAELQSDYEDYILQLNPKRVIFNPGAENFEFKKRLDQKGIESINACNLVMLRLGQF